MCYCGGQPDVENGVQQLKLLLQAMAEPIALQHHLDHYNNN
ncbi:hypothetical protein QUF64_09290 [Anaerolineales bacterium HSG6]|nr:hypothetical protein [Anaerolineales bacterium HSG6]MDM8531150.1 hypothetical protein [Anaerolineales bacterium HSG25]